MTRDVFGQDLPPLASPTCPWCGALPQLIVDTAQVIACPACERVYISGTTSAGER